MKRKGRRQAEEELLANLLHGPGNTLADMWPGVIPEAELEGWDIGVLCRYDTKYQLLFIDFIFNVCGVSLSLS